MSDCGSYTYSFRLTRVYLCKRQDKSRLHSLRRTVWKGGAKGCAYGVVTGTALTWGLPQVFFPPSPLGKFVHGPPQNKMLVVLICVQLGQPSWLHMKDTRKQFTWETFLKRDTKSRELPHIRKTDWMHRESLVPAKGRN